MRLPTLGLLALSLACGIVRAESLPKEGRYDARIKEVVYNASDVVKVIGHYGYSTDIQFAPGETAENIALGDSVAWEVAPAANHLFVKPSEDNAVTNMTVVTNRRVYQISLDARNTHGATSSRSRDMYFQVRYVYPEDEAQLAAQASARQLQHALDHAPEPRNWNYYGCGGREMQPSEVFDDGRFTYMRFPAQQEIPAIFIVGGDGTESIVNGGMRGEYYVVQRTAARFVLRRGQAVACIQNRSYNYYGIGTSTGTSSPDVVRTLKATGQATPSATIPGTRTDGPGAQGQPIPPGSVTPGWPLPSIRTTTTLPGGHNP